MKYIRLATPLMALGLLASGVLSAHTAFARGCPFMDGNKETKVTITDEQRKAARALVDTAQDTFVNIRHELYIKQNELKALHNSAFPDVNAVATKAKEITELRKKMQEEQDKLGIAIDKALGLEPGTHSFKRGMHGPKMGGCPSFGHEKRGRGHGMRGYGMKEHGGPHKGGSEFHRHHPEKMPMEGAPEAPQEKNQKTEKNDVEG